MNRPACFPLLLRQAHRPSLPAQPLSAPKPQHSWLLAGCCLCRACSSYSPAPGILRKVKLPVLLSYAPGKTALNVINKRGSIKSIILKAFEMQDARDQPAQPQDLSVLQHFSTNCECSAWVAWSQRAGRDIKCRNVSSSASPQLSIPTPSRGRQKTDHTCFSLLSQLDFSD